MMETGKSAVSGREGWAAGFYEEKWRLMALFFIPHHLLNLLRISVWNDSYLLSINTRACCFFFSSPFITDSLLLSLPVISSLFLF